MTNEPNEDITSMRMLVIEETEDGIEIDDPSKKLNDDERIGMLIRALVTELGEEIVATIESLKEAGDDDT